VKAEKEEAYAKKKDRKYREKEKQMLNFVQIQRKTLKVQERKLQVEETNAWSRAKKRRSKKKK
jgi:hypothetical protein